MFIIIIKNFYNWNLKTSVSKHWSNKKILSYKKKYWSVSILNVKKFVPASRKGHSSDDASCITTLYCNTQTLHQELEWTWFSSGYCNALTKVMEEWQRFVARHTQCLNRNGNESVKGGKRRVFGRLPWFRVVRHNSRSQHCSVKVTGG